MKQQITEPSILDSDTVAHAGYGSLIRNRQFMTLWIAQIFSQFADRAVFVLFVALLTIQHTADPRFANNGAAQLTSLLYVAFTIPAIILSPIAGVYVDRWNQRWVLVMSNVARAACVAIVAVPVMPKSMILYFALAFLCSVSTQFFGPAETASIPRLVKKNELYAANSLFFTTMMIALGFGFAIGEPIISHVGLGNSPIAIGLLFAISAFLLLFIRDSQPRHEVREPWWEELRFGLSYISSNALVFRAIMKITILFSTIITLNIVAVGLAEQVLKIQAFQFGFIVAAAGVGMGIGNFWVAHWGHKYNTDSVVYSGFTGLGLFMSLLGTLGFIETYLQGFMGWQTFHWNGPMMAVPLLLAMFTGASCGLVAVPTQAALQAAVPEELRGKVFGAQNTAMSAASTIPVVLAGTLIDNLPGGVSSTLFLIGIPILTAGLYHLARSRRTARYVQFED